MKSLDERIQSAFERLGTNVPNAFRAARQIRFTWKCITLRDASMVIGRSFFVVLVITGVST